MEIYESIVKYGKCVNANLWNVNVFMLFVLHSQFVGG